MVPLTSDLKELDCPWFPRRSKKDSFFEAIRESTATRSKARLPKVRIPKSWQTPNSEEVDPENRSTSFGGSILKNLVVSTD